MERRATGSLEGLEKIRDGGRAAAMRSHLKWPLGLKGSLLAVAALALLGVLSFTAIREATTTVRTPSAAVSRPAAPPKPAWTRAEEAYIQALWPIHGEVERNAVRLSLGRIFYKANEIGKAELMARVEAELTAFQQAEGRIQALKPTPSLSRAHDEYLAAIRLFQQSALETLKMFEDGDDGHLLAAYPVSREGSDKIREVGVKFWEDEFPPH